MTADSPAAPVPAPGAPSADGTDKEYHDISYDSGSFPQSSPPRVFALATLFGLSPPDARTARVLELGCSSGGNIIPLAERFPEARFVGVDLAQRHVDEGQARVKQLGLKNIEIVQGDVTTFSVEPESFDAVICHGVYSWVPEAAREAILAIAGRALTPNGVAYISYNVYPGWQMRMIIRDLMLYHAGTTGPAADRIAKARWVVENIAKMTPQANTSYAAKLKEEAAQLARLGDSYIYGEFLVPFNVPCYFRDFVALADRHGLAYLAETEVELSIPDSLGGEVAQLIRAMSSNQLIHAEQYIDFLLGRQFRQTLLVRKDNSLTIKRNLEPERVRHLHFSGPLAFSPPDSSADKFMFKTPQGRAITTPSLAVRSALDRFAAAFPESRTLGELLGELKAAGLPLPDSAETELLDALFKMAIAGIVRIGSETTRTARADARLLLAPATARADAAAGAKGTANLKHEFVLLDPVAIVLLPHIDGTNNRMRLRRQLVRAVEGGRIQIKDNQIGMPLQGEALEKAAGDHVELCLAGLAQNALLLPVDDLA